MVPEKGLEPSTQSNKHAAEHKGCLQNCQHAAVPSHEIESRLYEILTAWDSLSAPIKDAVCALVKSQTGGAT